MSLFSRVSLGLILVLAVTALGAGTSGASSDSSVSAARSCGSFRQSGGVYVYHLRAKGVRCRGARKVARSFNRCRHRHGRRGHCGHRVRRFKCKENRGASSPAQYTSTVRCRRGGKVIKFGYSQNT